MDLVDEKDVAVFKRREDADQILRFFKRRSAGWSKIRAHLTRDQSRKRRLSKSRRPIEEHVFEPLVATFSRVDRDTQIFDDLYLSNVFLKRARAQRNAVDFVFERIVRIEHAFVARILRDRKS